MLAVLAIINMAVAAALINDTADARTAQEPTAIVKIVDVKAQDTKDIYWAEE